MSSFVKGRAHEWYLNAEMRRRATLEAASDLVLCAAWADTRHQPADGGTRPDASGRLPLDRPLWVCANLILEVFAGTARMTSAARAHPFFKDSVCDPWDILYGECYDVLQISNLRRLLLLIGSGHVVFTWLGTPCSSFSKGRKWDGGPPPLRDPSNIVLPAPWISSPGDLEKVETGNKLAETSARIALVSHWARAWYVIENGHRTDLWRHPAIIEALSITGAADVEVDYCGWALDSLLGPGSPWQKRTRLSGTLPGLYVLGRRRCTGGRRCSFTGRSHVALSGKRDGVWLTRLAEPYPMGLCSAVIDLAAAAAAGRQP